MAQKKICGSQKLIYNMSKRSYNVTSMTICWSSLPVDGAVEAGQDLHEVPEQVTYMIHTCVAGMPVEKL